MEQREKCFLHDLLNHLATAKIHIETLYELITENPNFPVEQKEAARSALNVLNRMDVTIKEHRKQSSLSEAN